jgi:hypothetical protein
VGPRTPPLFRLGAFLAALFPLGGARVGEARSFAELFPGLGEEARGRVFSSGELVSSTRPGVLALPPAPGAGLSQGRLLEERKPHFLAESLLVIPYPAPWDASGEAGLLRIYNALGRIRDLAGRLYPSFTRGRDVPLFEEAFRIGGPGKTGALPDPPPAAALPPEETLYLRLKDANFGNSYYRAEFRREGPGLLYSLGNFRSLSYLFIPVIKEENFFARLYFEPLSEGILVYSVAGAEVSDFVASRIDMPSAIRKRLEVITGWVVDGIRAP